MSEGRPLLATRRRLRCSRRRRRAPPMRVMAAHSSSADVAACGASSPRCATRSTALQRGSSALAGACASTEKTISRREVGIAPLAKRVLQERLHRRDADGARHRLRRLARGRLDLPRHRVPRRRGHGGGTVTRRAQGRDVERRDRRRRPEARPRRDHGSPGGRPTRSRCGRRRAKKRRRRPATSSCSSAARSASRARSRPASSAA